MQKISKVILGLSVLLSTYSFGFATDVGDLAPDFSLTDTNGNSHTLSSDYQGKVVFLMYFGYS